MINLGFKLHDLQYPYLGSGYEQIIKDHFYFLLNLFGRKRKAKGFYESRNIDIDIIFIEDIVLKTQSLTIPHPRMHTRHFVLIPLCEISKEIFHPIKKKTVHELLLALPERLDIIKVNS